MKITLQSTSQIVNINGLEHRVWEGTTERGTRVTAFVSRIATRTDADASELDRELCETPSPRASEVWPSRLMFPEVN